MDLIYSGSCGLTIPEFDDYFQGVDQEVITELGENGFRGRLEAFLQMKNLLAAGTVYDSALTQEEIELIKEVSGDHVNPTPLSHEDFHLWLNKGLLSDREVKYINSGGLQEAAALYNRIYGQSENAGMVGVGLTNWGNNCWINTAIQTMFYRITPDQLASLSQQRDPDMAHLRETFKRLITKGQQIIKDQDSSADVTNEQFAFIDALIRCGRARKLGGMNGWFNCTSVHNIKQQDAAEFLSQLCEQMGVYDNGSQEVAIATCYKARINGREIYKEGNVNYSLNMLSSFIPTSTNPAGILMSDWLNSVTEMGAVGGGALVPWSQEDFMRAGVVEQAQQLFSQQVGLLRVDPTYFQQTVLTLNLGGGLRSLALQAMINSSIAENNMLRVPIIDARDGKVKTMVLRLCGAGLHAGNDARGHYLHMTLDANGQCLIQDDAVCASVEMYQQYAPGNGLANSWQELLQSRRLIPAYCEYEFVAVENGMPR